MAPTTADLIKSKTMLRQVAINKVSELLEFALRGVEDIQYENLFMAAFIDLSEIKESFYEHHNKIIGFVSEDDAFESQDKIRREFDLKVTRCRVHHDNFVAQSRPQTLPAQPAPAQRIPLPPLQLKRFDGDILEFSNFIELFRQIVHNNPSLSEIEKFNYLLSVLSGPALQVVKALPITAANYTVAFKTLVDRYSNNRAVASTLWTNIVDAPRVFSDNPADLRVLIGTFQESLDSLRNIRMPVDLLDFLLGQTLYRKLGPDIIAAFELQYNSNDILTYENLFKFLESRCIALENVLASQPCKPSRLKSSVASKPYRLSKTASSLVVRSEEPVEAVACALCHANHALSCCQSFLNQSPFERYRFAKSSSLCLKCLSASHLLSGCPSEIRCNKCNQRHHTLLHFDPHPNGSTAQPPPPQSSKASLTTSQVSLGTVSSSVLLATGLAEIKDNSNRFVVVRCLIDQGSMTSLISSRCMNALGLSSKKSVMHLSGLGDNSLVSNALANITLRAVNSEKRPFDVEAVVVPQICKQLPHSRLSSTLGKRFSSLALADPHYHVPGPIDVLLGADVFTKISLRGRVKHRNGNLIALNTIFGYILVGKVDASLPSVVTSSFFCAVDSLEHLVSRFWEVENVPPPETLLSQDEKLCESIFQESTVRDNSGRFVVQLPFRGDLPTFAGSRSLAVSRLVSLEKRLLKQPLLYAQYLAFMQEYFELGHMKEIVVDNSPSSYYIPHQCVVRPDSSSTKLRVVFNASARPVGGTSLNDHLLPGPKLQQDITSILLNFRCDAFVLTADIRMMYRQILIAPEHRPFQRIVCRLDPNSSIRDFELNTVTYGTTSAPYLAIKSLLQLADLEADKFPLAAETLKSSTYVDDIVVSCRTFSQARKLKCELIELLHSGGFELRKWSSNIPSLLDDLPPEHLSFNPLSFDEAEPATLKILGLRWCPTTDTFGFLVSPLTADCTKRSILSNLARIYDPLGMLSPLTFLIKHLIQKLWFLKLEWDQEPQSELVSLWQQLLKEFSCLKDVSCPRQMIPDSFELAELHCFGDASEKGYAAVVYLVFRSQQAYKVTFVCARSKVAPIKKLSLPRLELCAAVLVVRLLRSIVSSISPKLSIASIYCWTDSMIVLHWIRGEPHRWKTFVSNRVASIQAHSSVLSWKYVPSAYNPADIASRGLLPSELVRSSVWWAGPSFLSSTTRSFVSEAEPSISVEIEEESKAHVLVVTESPSQILALLDTFSSLSKCQRILSYIRRFIHNCRNPASRLVGPVQSHELHNSLIAFATQTQSVFFKQELSQLAQDKPLSRPLQRLAPFIDEGGLIRVGGRLSNAEIPFEAKHPILLPSHCRLTEMLIEFVHLRHLHAGCQTVQALLAQRFWVLSSRRTIRRVLFRCLRCWKARPRPIPPPRMGDLPSFRVSQVKPFVHTGVDFAGPFRIVMSRYRGAKTSKAYLCLFVCCATKALHLELASDLSSDAFLAALKRFIGRRGRCNHLYSDKGTNFVGASRQIAGFFESAAESEKISWHFNPPSAPHFGGLWESNIKNVKSHLLRVVGEQVLTYEELLTVLIQIEAVVNSRPLVPLSADPNDLMVLTPAHFLTLEPIVAFPEPDVTQINPSRLSRWQLLSQLV